MTDELQTLLDKYAESELSGDERQRLRELVSTPAGREAALRSRVPEAVFLSEDDTPLPEWEKFWPQFDIRLQGQSRRDPNRKPRSRWVAAAAVVLIGVLSVFFAVQQFSFGPPASSTAELQYKLEHRRPADVLPQIRDYLSGEASLNVDENGTITITDKSNNIETLRTVLPMLDREPIRLHFDLAFAYPKDPGAGKISQVDALPTEKLDRDAFAVLDELTIEPTEGSRFEAAIDGRWRVICFIRLNPEASVAHIDYFVVSDLSSGRTVLRANDIELAPGWTTALETEMAAENGAPVSLALSLQSDAE
jgi:hypothetical protein